MTEEYPYLSRSRIRKLFESSGFAIRKRWGQNFLVDPNHIRIISQAILEGSEGDIAEIGPGLGALSQAILKSGRQLYSMEIDPFLCTLLKEQFAKEERFHLLEGDALKFLGASGGAQVDARLENVKTLCGNLPYYITTDLILSGLRLKGLRRAIFLTQLEFARRATAGHSESSLTIFLRNFGTWKLVHRVPAQAFYPVPGVESALMSCDLHPSGPAVSPESLEAILRITYRGKRKKIINAWKMGDTGRVDLERLKEAAQRAGINTDLRPEEVEPDLYPALVRAYDEVSSPS